MKYDEIMQYVDHTALAVDATWENVKALCQEAMHYQTASVCIPACYVQQAKAFVGENLRLCTVIGFPNGYSTTAVKCFEAKMAVDQGADEIDMVIRVGWVKEGAYDLLLDEIRQVKAAVGTKLLKVIVESCLLTEDEIIQMCKVVGESGAEFIKTSTGFSKGGATPEVVALMASHVPSHLEIKAAGGIGSLADAERFVALGATRLGTSRLVKLAQQEGME